ncbi:MAG: divergent polysaccharide deacetylase family protein [Litorimonas sp.]
MTRSQRPMNTTLRRERLTLPSWRRHLVMAAITFAAAIALTFISLQIFGNSKDAQSFGSVSVEPIVEIAALAPLDDETLNTPDILSTELAAGQNPTQSATNNAQPALDALGNPLPQAGLTGLPNIGTTSEGPSSNGIRPNNNGSKTILIDGKAIGASSLPPAPFAGLTRETQYGTAPSKDDNGNSPLKSYNRRFTGASGQQPVSIIISGLGVNRALTQQAIDSLPPDVTLSFAAHVTGLQDWINRARTAGHEVMIEIPMDTINFNPAEPGADKALLTSQTASENMRNMEWLLSRAHGYFGVINYNGDTFLTRADVSAPILATLETSGLGFITDGDFSAPSLNALSQSVGLPYKNGFGLIDPEANTQIIRTKLDNLTSAAKSGAQPIGVGFAYPETIEAVTSWATDLETQNLILAPASHTLVK